MNLQTKIESWLDRQQIAENATVVVACSGGPDSMALLHLVHQSGRNAIAAHINYGKRGAESDRDEQTVRDFCDSLQVECCVKRLDSTSQKGNFQDWARKVRYKYFYHLLETRQADLILTAHHQDDHLETILMQVLKGSHPASWRGIPEMSGKVGRPFRDISSKEILQYIDQHAIPYQQDSSNFDSSYARNLIRNEQAERFDGLLPGWRQNLLRMTDYAEEFTEFGNYILNQICNSKGNLDRRKFLNLPGAIRKPVFASWLSSNAIGDQVARTQYERLDEIQTLQPGRKIQLNKDYVLEVDREELILKKNPTKCAYWSEFLSEDRLITGWETGIYRFRKAPLQEFDETCLQLNWDRLSFPLTLRTWRPGDQIQPIGMQGHKKISDVLTDEKVASTEKSEAMVIQGFDQSIYAVIFPASHDRTGIISEVIRCNPSTQTVLLITKLD